MARHSAIVRSQDPDSLFAVAIDESAIDQLIVGGEPECARLIFIVAPSLFGCLRPHRHAEPSEHEDSEQNPCTESDRDPHAAVACRLA